MIRSLYISLFFLIFIHQAYGQQRQLTISGYVREQGSKELLPGVNVYVPGSPVATSTNTYGFYSMSFSSKDSTVVSYSFVGYGRKDVKITGTSNQEINVELASTNILDEVVISQARQNDKVSESIQMSQIEVPIAQIKRIPAFFGEKDAIRVLQLMPGVQKGSEGQTGLYVRGGGPDQNLIILDDAVVYNASHLFGFFSVFNSDALKSVSLTKGGFPARFGGRLSSVVEMNMKEGSKEKLHGEGGIGVISSRFTLEGPLANKKASFLISARRTYIDLLAAPFLTSLQKKEGYDGRPGYYFYDINAKLNYDFGSKDKLYASGYFGRDKFKVEDKSEIGDNRNGLNWGNATATLRWNHLFNQKLFVNTSLIYSHFNFNIFASEKDLKEGEVVNEYSLKYNSLIKDFTLKTDFDYYPGPKHSVRFGLQLTSHQFVPSAIAVAGDFSDNEITGQTERVNSMEGGIYAEDTWQPLPPLKVNAGFRLSTFQTASKTYFRPEPRIAAAFKLAPNLSAKASYARMNQYVHLLSNTGLGLPTDLWVPTTDRVAPQQSSQLAAGFAKDLEKPGLAITLEGYYKKMNNIISYKEGATFIRLDGENANELSWQDNITSGKGWSYGAELLVQKKTGKLTGWVGYTLSWTKWRFPELNFGKTFYPRYDRRHDISIVGMYELSKRITLSASWVYGTGNALTIPNAKFATFRNTYLPQTYNYHQFMNNDTDYGQKNSFRAEAYHRLDLAVQFHKKKKHFERTWEVGVYNAYSRRNPFFYNMTYAVSEQKLINVLKRYSLFPVLPSVSYNFKF
jgi:hypothetical protein